MEIIQTSKNVQLKEKFSKFFLLQKVWSKFYSN